MSILLTIPKGNADTPGVGMLEVAWKVVEAVIYNWIKTVVQLHIVLYGFRAGRGAGTTIMELKIAQELSSVDQDIQLLVFLELRKTYKNVDQGRIL